MIRHLLNANVDVWRASFTSDGRGGRTRTMAKVGTIRARVRPLPKMLEERVAGEMGELEFYVAYVLADADVRREDELDTGLARRLRVLSVVKDSTSTYKRVEAQLVEGS